MRRQVFVESIVEGGNAEQEGSIQVSTLPCPMLQTDAPAAM